MTVIKKKNSLLKKIANHFALKASLKENVQEKENVKQTNAGKKIYEVKKLNNKINFL